MKNTLKKSMVALKAAAIALVAIILTMVSPMTAFASGWTGGNEPAPQPIVTAPAETAGLGFWMWFLILLVAIMVVSIVVYLVVNSAKQRKAELQEIVDTSQRAVVATINPNYRLRNNGTNLELYEEAPVNRTANADGTVTYGNTNTPAPSNPAPGTGSGNTSWY
jgi:heme exporter protein D